MTLSGRIFPILAVLASSLLPSLVIFAPPQAWIGARTGLAETLCNHKVSEMDGAGQRMPLTAGAISKAWLMDGAEAAWLLLLPPLITAIMTLAAGMFAETPGSPLDWAKLIAEREYRQEAALP